MYNDNQSTATAEPVVVSEENDRPEAPIRVPPPRRQNSRAGQRVLPNQNGPSERTAVIIILALVALLSTVAIVIGLRWNTLMQDFMFLPPGAYMVPDQTPATALPELRHAPNGDGTVLILEARPQAAPMSLQNIYRKVSPSVVAVTSSSSMGEAEGSGVLMSDDGYLITNEHVISGASQVTVTLPEGSEYDALLVGYDMNTDLAVLKIDAKGLTPAEFGSSDDMVVGDTVAAIGNPLGSELRGTMTDGILSALNRELEVEGYHMTLMQTTAALNSGNSGGALVNDQGQVIGVTNMKMVTGGYSAPIEGLGFAIPTTVVKTVVNALIETGYVPGRPMLGITVRPAYGAELEEAGQSHGLIVNAVNAGSDAEAKGILKGDLLLAANGVELYANADLLELKSALNVGDSIELSLIRKGEPMTISILLLEQNQIG